MGVLQQRLGEHNATHHAFKAALRADPHYEPAREGLRRQCHRLGPDVLRSSGHAAERRGQLDPFSRMNDRIGAAELTRLYDRSRRYLGLDSGDEPCPGPLRERGR
jgi:hypothetical protein